MKNVIVVARKGNAVALGEGIKICKSSHSTMLPSMFAINEILESIPVEASETIHIHVMDTVQGIVTGSAIEYVKTGKTGTTNRALTTEEIKAYEDFYKLYASRILNVRFSQAKYMKSTDVELQNLKKQAYDELAAYEKSAVAIAPVQAITVDPDKELREMFNEQIKEAMAVKDMALVKQLMEMRSELKEPTVSTGTQEYKPVTFENAEGNSAPIENTDKENEDSPINFESASGEQPSF